MTLLTVASGTPAASMMETALCFSAWHGNLVRFPYPTEVPC